MSTRFSEDIVPLSDLKINPGKVASHAQETHRPILLTSRGRGVAVVRSLTDAERETSEDALTSAHSGDVDGRRANSLGGGGIAHEGKQSALSFE